ncbi:MAG: translation initiation factor eIF-2B [Rhodospirillales bacterium]
MPLPPLVQARIEAIRINRTSGAADLTAEAAEALVLAAEIAPHTVEEAARAIAAAQPLMAPLVNLGRAVSAAEDPRAAAREFVSRMREAAPRVAENGARLIRSGESVLTHSYSSAVLEAFRAAHAAGTRFRAVCTESRPLCEGATLAARLAGEGIETVLIPDAAAASLLRECALVLVGADAVSTRGVVNKIGTALIAMAAAALHVPVYALCSSEKMLPPDYELPPEPAKDPREILAEPVPNLAVRNYYFEWTPIEYITGIVTETGHSNPRGRTTERRTKE